MTKYYIYIEKERTRVYTDLSNGKPIELAIDEVKTTELYNTCTYNIDTGRVDFEPLHRSYEQNYMNLFSEDAAIAGVPLKKGLGPLFMHFRDVLLLLEDKHGEVRILISDTMADSFCDESRCLDFDSAYQYAIDWVNNTHNTSFVFKGSYFVKYLVQSLINFVNARVEKGLIYIDEKMYILLKKKHDGVMRHFVGWGAKSFDLTSKAFDEFNKYLKREELFSSPSESDDIKTYIFHEAKKGNLIDKISIIRRDEKQEIDCSILRECINRHEQEKYSELNDTFISDSKNINQGMLCFVNVNKEDTKEGVLRVLDNYNLTIKYPDEFFSCLLRYCEEIERVNCAKYRLRERDVISRGRARKDHIEINGKIYFINLLMNDHEINEVCERINLKNVIK